MDDEKEKDSVKLKKLMMTWTFCCSLTLSLLFLVVVWDLFPCPKKRKSSARGR